MSILALTSDTLIVTPASGNLEYNGQFFGTDSAGSRAQLQRITQGTAVASTSGTSIDFNSLPAWVKRITVNFGNVSVSGSAVVMVQLGDSGGVETTGYDSNVTTTVGVNAGTYTKTSTTAGIELAYDSSSATLYAGCLTWNLIDSNLWCCSFVLSANNDARMFYGAGTKTLSATLDRVRITTTNGTDTFDAGTVNIMYEG